MSSVSSRATQFAARATHATCSITCKRLMSTRTAVKKLEGKPNGVRRNLCTTVTSLDRFVSRPPKLTQTSTRNQRQRVDDAETLALRGSLRTALSRLKHEKQQLADRYLVITDKTRRLGQGRHGIVRPAIHRYSGRDVAVKSIDKFQSNWYLNEEDLLHEVRTLDRLQGHPNIMELIEVFDAPINLHLVTETCLGGDMFGYMDSLDFEPLPSHQVRAVARQLLAAVSYCHESGVVHLDIKPENVMIRRSLKPNDKNNNDINDLSNNNYINNINRKNASNKSNNGSSIINNNNTIISNNNNNKSASASSIADQWSYDDLVLVDFGHCRLCPPDEKHGKDLQKLERMVGSPSYGSPEVILNSKFSELSDAYSVGVILYVAMTGCLPYPHLQSTCVEDFRLSDYEDVDPFCDPDDWVLFPPEALETVRGLMAVDHKARMSVDEALNGPWLRLGASNMEPSIMTHYARREFLQSGISNLVWGVPVHRSSSNLSTSLRTGRRGRRPLPVNAWSMVNRKKCVDKSATVVAALSGTSSPSVFAPT